MLRLIPYIHFSFQCITTLIIIIIEGNTVSAALSTASAAPEPYFNNSCLKNQPLNPPNQATAPQTFLNDCAQWVIDSTDETWHKPIENIQDYRSNVLEKYFYWNFTSHGSFGGVSIGLDSLQDSILSIKESFPDLKIHISDVVCIGNDVDGYKTIMPDVLIGTNKSPSVYSKNKTEAGGTGEVVVYNGIAVTYVQKVPILDETSSSTIRYEWAYISEWVLHDELSIVRQLHLMDTDEDEHDTGDFQFPSNDVAHINQGCHVNKPSWGFRPTLKPSDDTVSVTVSEHSFVRGNNKGREDNKKNHDYKSEPDARYTKDSLSADAMPKAKQVIKNMDDFFISGNNARDWKDYESWSAQVEPFFTTNMIYDTIFVPEEVYMKAEGHQIFNNGTGIRSWYLREHLPYDTSFGNYSSNQMIFVGDENYASTTTYHKVHWREPFIGLKNPPIGVDGDYWNGNGNMPDFIIRVTDFYIILENRIFYNWMWIDTISLMHQWAKYFNVPRVIPKPPLLEYFRPPNSLDGFPSPVSNFVDAKETKKVKELFDTLVKKEFEELNANFDCHENIDSFFHFDSPDFRFYGPEGIGVATDCQEYQMGIKDVVFYKPFTHTQTNEMSIDRVFNVQVSVCEGLYCAVNGEVFGTHTGEFLGEKASNENISIRFGMHFRAEEVEVAENEWQIRFIEAWMILDIPSAFHDMGVNLWDRIPQDLKSASGKMMLDKDGDEVIDIRFKE